MTDFDSGLTDLAERLLTAETLTDLAGWTPFVLRVRDRLRDLERAVSVAERLLSVCEFDAEEDVADLASFHGVAGWDTTKPLASLSTRPNG